MRIYNQNVIIDKFNQYLKYKNRQINFKYGYCHGIAIFWLYKMLNGEEEWFYESVKKILACKTDEDFDTYEFTFEKFISHIEWLQNSENYLPTVHQLHVDRLLDAPKKISIPYLFTHKQLEENLASIIPKNTMISVSGPNHTIGVFRRGDRYHLFDSNYDQGRAKSFSKIKKLKLEILRCLFGKRPIFEDKIPLEFNIVSFNQEQLKFSGIHRDKLLNELLESSEDIDEADYDGISNLYLACENDDPHEVSLLLAKDVNPNQIMHADWTPLQKAACDGYVQIVDLLLQYKADPNLADKKGNTPLHFAVLKGHEVIISLLLKNGANPNAENNKKDTPLSLAVKYKNFKLMAELMAYIKPDESLAASAAATPLKKSKRTRKRTNADASRFFKSNSQDVVMAEKCQSRLVIK